MDLSSSAVIKRHLIEPIKLDATIKRSLLPSTHEIPIVECSATLDFVKVLYSNFSIIHPIVLVSYMVCRIRLGLLLAISSPAASSRSDCRSVSPESNFIKKKKKYIYIYISYIFAPALPVQIHEYFFSKTHLFTIHSQGL